VKGYLYKVARKIPGYTLGRDLLTLFSRTTVGQVVFGVRQVSRSSHPRKKVTQPTRENGTSPKA